jgi:uncharacterized protein YwgA
MFDEYVKISLVVDACGGEIDGRKKLQKMVYIAKVLGYPLREEYTLYLYGPYSEDLAGELQRMKELNILHEHKLDSSYHIRITQNGKEFLNYFQSTIENDVGTEKLNKMKTLFKELHCYNPWELEMLATLFYFYQIGHNDFNELQEVVGRVKPKFSSSQISTMMNNVQALIENFAVDQ